MEKRERVLNPVSRGVAWAALTVGGLGTLAHESWKWLAGGVIVAVGVTVAGPWKDKR